MRNIIQGPLHRVEIEVWEGTRGLVIVDDLLVDSFVGREALNSSLDATLEAIRQGKAPISNEDGVFLGWCWQVDRNIH